MREDKRVPRASIITPGNHDGVHRGHRALVQRASVLASKRGLATTALFFYPNAAAILAPERAPGVLTLPARRAELLREAGADQVEIQAFDRSFAHMPAETFVRQVLVERLHCRGLVVGQDFRFGRDRQGDVALLHALGPQLNLTVETLPPVVHEGEVISSSRIRRALGAGDVGTAASMLTRLHEVDAVVVRGDARGRTIGFPTANLRTSEVLLPADGVYAVLMRRRDMAEAPLLEGVANLGTRPTFEAGRSVEVHLLDFDGDLYDADVRVGFVERIRDERRFESVDALVAQLTRDVARGRELLSAIPEGSARWM